MIPDPDDFIDQNEPEGTSQENQDAGKEGTGGLSTKDAEESYERAATEHFRNDNIGSIGGKSTKSNKKISTIPQIGSIEDDKNTRYED